MPKGAAKINKKNLGKSGISKSINDIQSSKKKSTSQDNSGELDTGRDITSNEQGNPIPNLDSPVEINGINQVTEAVNGKKTSDPKLDLNLFIDDVRETIKERTLIDSSSQILPGSAYQKNKKIPKFFQKIDNWLYGKVRNPFRSYQHVIGAPKKKRFPFGLIIIIIVLISLAYFFIMTGTKLKQATPVIIPTFTPVPTYSIPVPYTIQFPGGWTFYLGISEKPFTEWKPIDAEWLQGTTICKLIAIPWTKQIDAVYKTLLPGEDIILTMNNSDQTIYQIESLEDSLVDDLIKKLDRNSPCMVIFLYSEGSSTTQMLISVPATTP